jgi:hypothetical protein
MRQLAYLCLLAAPAALAAQTPATSAAARVASALDARVLRAHIEFLADDALEGRAPGTRGGATAARYIATQFERIGLEPAGDSGTWYQRVPIISLTPEPTLAAERPSVGPLAWKKDFVMWSMRNDSLVDARADAVFVGYGIVAPEYGWNDYAGVDAKGKIVITLVNDPGLRDSAIFRGKILTYYGRWTYKIEEAQRQGAAGILMIHTTESATYPWTTVLSGWVGPQVRLTPRGRLAPAGRRRPAVPAVRAGPCGPHSGGGAPWIQGGAARSSARRGGAKHDPPLRDEQRARALARPRAACARDGADRRPLRSFRDRRAGRW